jgi:hypothetical protein
MSAPKEVESNGKAQAKQVLLHEVRLALELNENGVNFNPDEITRLKSGNIVEDPYRRDKSALGFSLPHGITANAKYARWTPYSIVVENGRPFLLYDEGVIAEITLDEPAQHPELDQVLTTGEKVRSILSIDPHGQVNVGFSDECSLKDRGEDCLFCSYNVRERDPERPKIKNSRQIAEAYDIVRKAGKANHFKISGGFIPEHRELESYLDVVETIREKHKKFSGVAVISAPADLSILSKYKEAGYTDISHNLEVWDKDLFALVCPGKSNRDGGWQHWIDSLEAAVEIFGKGHVHSNFVGGLDSKDAFIDGIEYLSSKGIVAHFGVFRPEKGTPFEGHRSPDAAYHWELLDRATDIQLRHGFTIEQMYRGPGSGDHTGRVLRIKKGAFEGDRLEIYQFPPLD